MSSLSDVQNEDDPTFGFLFRSQDVDEIDHNLWQGSWPHHLDKKFQFVINVANDKKYPEYKTDMNQHQISTFFKDSEYVMPDDELLHGLADMVNRFRKIGPVLVHCHAGLNRSGLIVALSLMKTGYSANDAITKVKSRRPRALYNQRFCRWLMELEAKDYRKTNCPLCGSKLSVSANRTFCNNDACEVYDAPDYYWTRRDELGRIEINLPSVK